MSTRDGMNYAPSAAKVEKVVKPGEFNFAVAYLDHGHIFGQMNGLTEAGGECRWVYDPQPERAHAFADKYPGVQVAESFDQILADPDVKLVAAAAVPCDRASIGFKVLRAGKDYFTDKSPFTTLGQLEEARSVVKETVRKYMCYYSERIHTEAGFYAGELIRQGVIGDVLQVLIMAPHNLAKASRPDWFFGKDKYGGIITDIGSHQFEQFLTYTGSSEATVNFARVANFANPDKPGLEDFGEASLTTDTGASCYCRMDWFNPGGLRSWGDGRTFILGTKGTIEVRKYIDITTEPLESQIIYLVDGEKEQRIPCSGKVGFPYFGQLILDVLNRTESAMTQEHCFKAAELALRAQAFADEAAS
jgi:predicted dehydrogenase